MKKIIYSVILSLAIFLSTGCFGEKNMEEITINTTVYPITFIANTLYTENAAITSVYPNGVDLNKFKLTPKQEKEYAKADIFIYNGLTQEKDIAKNFINRNKRISIIDISYGLKYTYGVEELWLAPNNFLMISKNVKESLKNYVSNKYTKQMIDKNYKKLEETVSLMDAELRNIANNAKQNNKNVIVTSNDTLKYLTSYGFNVISLKDEENNKNNSLNILKSNFKNGKYSTIFMLSTDEETDLIKQLKSDYNAKVVIVDSMISLSQDNINAGNDYIMIMNEYLDSIRTATSN
ncbi:MAG: zinc ABC transporter substrate-binding protein [Bacilli bacterium]|nr:zinc ABC transporter substrate-binding protein [Bacilli bacterium]